MESYVAKKSAWAVLNFWRILSCILIIPIFTTIYKIFLLKNETITFYEDKIVVRKGVLTRNEKTFAFQGVYAVSVRQGLGGRIFGYGKVDADFVGVHDLHLDSIKDPDKLAEFLQTRIVKREEMRKEDVLMMMRGYRQ